MRLQQNAFVVSALLTALGCSSEQAEVPVTAEAIPGQAVFAMDDGEESTGGQTNGQALTTAPPLTAVQLHQLVAEQNASLACAAKPIEPLAKQKPATTGDGTSLFTLTNVDVGGVKADMQAVIKPDAMTADNFGSSVIFSPNRGSTVSRPDGTMLTGSTIGSGFFSLSREASQVGKPIRKGAVAGIDALGIKSGFKADFGQISMALGASQMSTTAAPIAGTVAFSAEHTPSASVWQAQLKDYKNGVCVTGVDNSATRDPIVCPADTGKHQVHRIKSSKKFPGRPVVLARALGWRNILQKSEACEREIVRVRSVVGVGGWGRATIYGGDVPAGFALVFRETWGASGGGTEYRRSWICPFDQSRALSEATQGTINYSQCKVRLLPNLPAVGGTAPEMVMDDALSNPLDQTHLADLTTAVSAASGASMDLAAAIAREGDPVSDTTTVSADESRSAILDLSEMLDETSDQVSDLALAADGTAKAPTVSGSILVSTAPGTYSRSISSGGLLRTYLLYIPQGYDGTTAVPLVLVFHGGGQTAQYMVGKTGFNAKADKEKFVVAYLNGSGDPQLWNSGFVPDVLSPPDADDVLFVKDVIAKLNNQLNIDDNRIYATGFSNGSFMTHRLGADLPDVLAAIAPVASTVGISSQISDGDFCTTSDAQPADNTYTLLANVHPAEAPIPVLIIHGTADTHIPWIGGEGDNAEYFCVRPLTETVKFWTDANGCTGTPQVQMSPDGNVTTEVYAPCTSKKPVVLHKVCTAIHAWPSPGPVTGTGCPNSCCSQMSCSLTSSSFSATDAIWAFFAAHPKSP